MKKMAHFFECYFNQSYDFTELDKMIHEYKISENPDRLHALIVELHTIIQTNNYKLAMRIMEKYGYLSLDDLEEAEKFIKYIYDRFIDRPTNVKADDFTKKCKVVFCPICCPNNKIETFYSLIEKATVIDNNLQIYICKLCKSAWSTEDIRADNAQDYKKFMRKLSLKGLWKELKDVDIL